MSRPNATGYKGVHLKRNRYVAAGWDGVRNVHLGHFNTPEEASEAYQKWEKNRPTREVVRYKEERSSPEILAIVDDVFRRLIKNDRSRS